MCIVTLRALPTMSVLAAAKRSAIAVVQNCKVLSRLSKCVIILAQNIKVRVIIF